MPYTLNPFTANFDYYQAVAVDQSYYNSSTTTYNSLLYSWNGTELLGLTTGIVSTKTTNDTLTNTDAYGLTLVDASSGAVTITLPSALTSSALEFRVKKIDSSANNVIVDGDGSETIDGATTATITTQYESITLISNGTGWYIK